MSLFSQHNFGKQELKMMQDKFGRLCPSPIETMSVELVRMILLALPDVASLQTAVLSCPLFYHAFLEVETGITADVLSNQVDISVLPEAMAASASSSLRVHDTDRKSREAIDDFVSQNLRRRPDPPRWWSLERALLLGKLHSSVEWFAKTFASAALIQHPLNRSQSVTSRHEIFRIQRALYRFEVYCNLFREAGEAQSVVHEDQKILFFANFAPWENEQLGCIHDFLVKIISPAFDDVAEHDIAWGAFFVEYGGRVDSPYMQHVLSLGLVKLQQIAKSETYDERYKLLHTGYCPEATESFLYEGLLQGANEHNNEDIFVDDLTPENEGLYIKQISFSDPDSGPTDAWRWAHREDTWSNWVYQEDRHGLRRWGYVMWDRSRLETAGIFQEPWESIYRPEDRLLEEQEATRQRAYMENSWEQRAHVYNRGGTGWWSWGDESKVQWRDSGTSGRGPSVRKHVQPNSLTEARDMLGMMKLPSSSLR